MLPGMLTRDPGTPASRTSPPPPDPQAAGTVPAWSAHMRAMEQTTLAGSASYSIPIANTKGPQRRIAHRATLDVPLRSVTSEQAPVAALISSSREFRARWPHRTAELRTLDGQLYSQPFDTQGQPLKPGSEYLDRHLILSFSGNWGLQEAEAAIRRGLGRYILIDGEIWTLVVEPVILAGSNSLTITSGNGNHRGAHEVFALTELDAAEQAQLAFDTKHGMKSKDTPTVDIRIPGVFQVPTSAERVQAARDEADKAVAAEIANLWIDRSPSAIQKAGLALMTLAGELSRQTGRD